LEAKDSGEFGETGGFRLSFVRADWPSRPVDTRFGPLVLVSIPFLVIAAFILVAFVGWGCCDEYLQMLSHQSRGTV